MNTPYRQKIASFSCLFFLFFCLPACSTLQDKTTSAVTSSVYYHSPPPTSIAADNCPVFLVERSDIPYNRIGTPAAKDNNGKAYIWVDPSTPSVYFQEQKFSTAKGQYTNLIYRVHFERIPLPHLTAGKNTGLLIIVTLDSANRPLLISTVHTCGCFLSITPTSYLAAASYPDNWNIDTNYVYGENLPGLLDYTGVASQHPRFLLKIRSETHRVMDISLIAPDKINSLTESMTVNLRPMQDLHALPFKSDLLSFYEKRGLRRGHVVNSRKPLEMLFMGWWAMDPFIGEDKEFGPASKTGTTFYTSLKFWRRQDSNLWNFGRAIKPRGWKL